MGEINNHSSRLEYEANFFDKRTEQIQYQDEDLIVPDNIRIIKFLGIDLRRAPMKVLDCGCGTGYISVLLAKYGMNVSSIDISPKSIEITKKRAEVNQVSDRVEAKVMPLENLDYNDNTFDLVVGDMILHHVILEKCAKEIIRVLKPGAKAIFRETSGRNKVLMIARRLLPGHFGIPKYRDEIEHPITNKDIKTLTKMTNGKCKCIYFGFNFFKILDWYIFRSRFKSIKKILSILDKFVYRYLPFLRKYSYYMVIELSK
jgi:ubiquinone/menaquinone biosynthesis C-methylase UbiE